MLQVTSTIYLIILTYYFESHALICQIVGYFTRIQAYIQAKYRWESYPTVDIVKASIVLIIYLHT
jgi:hypothetical protein